MITLVTNSHDPLRTMLRNYWITNANQLWTGRVLGNDPRHMPDWLRPVLFGTALLECVTFLIMFILIPPHRKAELQTLNPNPKS